MQRIVKERNRELGDGLPPLHEAHRGADGRGMLTSPVLTLIVIPAAYSLWKEREVSIARHGEVGTPVSASAPAYGG
jgi:hypothetical protein